MCSDISLASFKRSISFFISCFFVLPLGLVPAIGLIVTVLSLTRTSISGLEPTILNFGKLNRYINGEGFVSLKTSYSFVGL